MSDQQIVRSDEPSPAPSRDEIWRKEIHARVAGYRSRRGRRLEGAYSMRFPFPPAEIESSQPIVETQDYAEDGFNPAAVSAAGDLPVDVTAAVAAPEPECAPAAIAFEAAAVLPKASEENNSATLEDGESSAEARRADPIPEPLPAPATPRSRPRRKVIAFPRQPSAEVEPRYRLADPI